MELESDDEYDGDLSLSDSLSDFQLGLEHELDEWELDISGVESNDSVAADDELQELEDLVQDLQESASDVPPVERQPHRSAQKGTLSNEFDTPLFDGANLTVFDSFLLLMHFLLR